MNKIEEKTHKFFTIVRWIITIGIIVLVIFCLGLYGCAYIKS